MHTLVVCFGMQCNQLDERAAFAKDGGLAEGGGGA